MPKGVEIPRGNCLIELTDCLLVDEEEKVILLIDNQDQSAQEDFSSERIVFMSSY